MKRALGVIFLNQMKKVMSQNFIFCQRSDFVRNSVFGWPCCELFEQPKVPRAWRTVWMQCRWGDMFTESVHAPIPSPIRSFPHIPAPVNLARPILVCPPHRTGAMVNLRPTIYFPYWRLRPEGIWSHFYTLKWKLQNFFQPFMYPCSPMALWSQTTSI